MWQNIGLFLCPLNSNIKNNKINQQNDRKQVGNAYFKTLPFYLIHS